MNTRFYRTNYRLITSLIISLLLIIPTISTWGQTIISPTYSKRDNTCLRIDEIEKTVDYTIIKGVYENKYSSGWANINNTAYLKDCKSGQKYQIVKSEGIPMSPNKIEFSRKGETAHYKFYFPAIENDVELVDMIEGDASISSFNFYGLALKDGVQRDFSISYSKGQMIKSKPSLQRRIDGVKEIQLYVPNNMTDLDKYIYGNFANYLYELGLKVDVVPAKFANKPVQAGTVYGYYRIFDEDVLLYLKNANTLATVVNYTCTQGQYVGGTSLSITFVDQINEYTWTIQQFDLPSKAERYKNKLKKEIVSTYNYNPIYAFVPPSAISTWSEGILREYLVKNNSNPLEGIYKGDQYTLGVKKGDDGLYYVLYLDGADNIEDWKEGDIKATLTATATPTLFKADWLGRWKQNMDMTITFMNGAMVVIDKDKYQDTYIKMFPDIQTITQNSASSGSGFFLSNDGYIITNYHVIENARSIKISGVNDDYHKSYTARVEISDKQNDLAILKISDSTFQPLKCIPYTFKYETSSVGEDCFVLGYPLISTMGMDIKLTNGIISSKTGFEGNIADYQISAPVQPGNSGGPLFDKNGNIIGVVCAKHLEAENAGYAIKANYIRNLVELLPKEIQMPKTNLLSGKTLPEQVELASKAVCLIIVNDE